MCFRGRSVRRVGVLGESWALKRKKPGCLNPGLPFSGGGEILGMKGAAYFDSRDFVTPIGVGRFSGLLF